MDFILNFATFGSKVKIIADQTLNPITLNQERNLTSRAVDLAHAFFSTLACKLNISRWRGWHWVRQTTNANRWATRRYKIMKQLKLYTEYSRDEAIASLIPIRDVTEFSNGELIVAGKVGIIFAVISQPLSHSYLVSNRVFRWFSAEKIVEFYNSTMLSFPSIYRKADNILYLFAKRPNDLHYLFLGSIRMTGADIPSVGYPISQREYFTNIIIQFEIEPPLPLEVWAGFDWSKEQIIINGLPLPQTLLTLITQNRWPPPTELAPYHDVFDRYTSQGGQFYTPDQMERDTDGLWKLYQDGYGDDFSLCETDDQSHTKLLLSKAVCLGDTGPETAFCLDYRDSKTEPCVVYLGASDAWKVIAPDIETFARKLGL